MLQLLFKCGGLWDLDLLLLGLICTEVRIPRGTKRDQSEFIEALMRKVTSYLWSGLDDSFLDEDILPFRRLARWSIVLVPTIAHCSRNHNQQPSVPLLAALWFASSRRFCRQKFCDEPSRTAGDANCSKKKSQTEVELLLELGFPVHSICRELSRLKTVNFR